MVTLAMQRMTQRGQLQSSSRLSKVRGWERSNFFFKVVVVISDLMCKLLRSSRDYNLTIDQTTSKWCIFGWTWIFSWSQKGQYCFEVFGKVGVQIPLLCPCTDCCFQFGLWVFLGRFKIWAIFKTRHSPFLSRTISRLGHSLIVRYNLDGSGF